MRGSLPGFQQELDTKAGSNTDDESLLVDMEFTCPVCERKLKVKEPRMSKIRPDGNDKIFRPKFKNLDVLKYQVIECPVCAYADLKKNFSQAGAKVAAVYKKQGYSEKLDASLNVGARDYEAAFGHHRAALEAAEKCGFKAGKKAYLSLLSAWLLRSWRESEPVLSGGSGDGDFREAEEDRLLNLAVENFREAEKSEEFPICGLTETTYDCIMGALMFRIKEYSSAAKYLHRALQNKNLKLNYRTIAEDLRESIKEELRNK